MTCCDGTGWTGVEGVICAEHYEPCGDLLSLAWEGWADAYDDDPSPYLGTYSEE